MFRHWICMFVVVGWVDWFRAGHLIFLYTYETEQGGRGAQTRERKRKGNSVCPVFGPSGSFHSVPTVPSDITNLVVNILSWDRSRLSRS